MNPGSEIPFDVVSATFWGIAIGCVAWLSTGVLIRNLEQRRILDIPNERSSHSRPTPRGGGLALVAVLGIAWAISANIWTLSSPALDWPVFAGFAGLALLSWFDDLKGLGPPVRLAGHLAAVAVALPGLTTAGPIFQGILPDWADLILAGLIWAGYLNFFNFMDGIDGISGVETAAIGSGVCVLAALGVTEGSIGFAGLALVAASAGFLVWNWAPARIFLGDVGSVPLGYLTGALLLGLAASGYWLAALLLPAYYLSDAGLTLLRRAARGEKIWQAHREHFYQRAHQNGRGHATISLGIAVANVVLVCLAGVSAIIETSFLGTIGLLSCGAVVVGVLLTWMAR